MVRHAFVSRVGAEVEGQQLLADLASGYEPGNTIVETTELTACRFAGHKQLGEEVHSRLEVTWRCMLGFGGV